MLEEIIIETETLKIDEVEVETEIGRMSMREKAVQEAATITMRIEEIRIVIRVRVITAIDQMRAEVEESIVEEVIEAVLGMIMTTTVIVVAVVIITVVIVAEAIMAVVAVFIMVVIVVDIVVVPVVNKVQMNKDPEEALKSSRTFSNLKISLTGDCINIACDLSQTCNPKGLNSLSYETSMMYSEIQKLMMAAERFSLH